MADNPDGQPHSDPSPEDAAIDQGAIDELLKGAAQEGGAVDGADAPDQPADSDQTEQKDLGAPQEGEPRDASAAVEETSPESTASDPADTPSPDTASSDLQAQPDALSASAEEAPAEPAEASSGAADGVDQSEIDALLASAGQTDDAAGAGGEQPQASGEDAPLDSMGRPFDEFAAAMQAAIEEEDVETPADTVEATPVDLPELGPPANGNIDANQLSMLGDVKLRVKIELGRTRMLVEDVLKLGEGSVVELDKLAGDPVDVLVNDRLAARGEVLVLNDNFCVRISEVLSNDPHRVSV